MASLPACVEDRDGHLSGGYTEDPVSWVANRQVQREISAVMQSQKILGTRVQAHRRMQCVAQ